MKIKLSQLDLYQNEFLNPSAKLKIQRNSIMFAWDCCRTCLSKENLNSVSSLNEEKEYIEMVFIITGVKITSTDQLPKQLCIECTNFIQISSKFREKCKKTQELLYIQLKNQFGLKIEIDSNNDQDNSNYIEINIDELKKEDSVHNKNVVKTEKAKNLHLFDDNSHSNDNPIENPDINFIATELTESIVNKRNETQIETKESIRRLKNPKKEPKTLKKAITPKKGQKIPKIKHNNEKFIKKNLNLKDDSDKPVDHKTMTAKSSKDEIICKICSKVLKSKFSVHNHMKIHTGFNIVCEHCGSKFLSRPALQMHCKAMHGYEKTDKCSYCDYKGCSPYAVRHCGKKFITRRLLLMHCKARHGYEKTDKCSFCEYTGCNKEQVQVHERIHTGERPFACSECGASFIRKSCYLQHAAIHLPEKTVQCEQCPAKFKSVTLMKIHRNKHRDSLLYSYKCYICDSSFTRKRNVLRHLQRIHSVLEATQKIERVAK